MSERKVLNKYYPPDFDPSKIPKRKLPKDRQSGVRLMAPFQMRCRTCGEYISQGKKLNARKETVPKKVSLGLPIFRFDVRCPRCLADIPFQTDPGNTDSAVGQGATRSLQAEEEEERRQKEREDDPGKGLENRTKDSQLEVEVLEHLRELQERSQRQAQVDSQSLLRQCQEGEREVTAMLAQAQARRLREDSGADAASPRGPHSAPSLRGPRSQSPVGTTSEHFRPSAARGTCRSPKQGGNLWTEGLTDRHLVVSLAQLPSAFWKECGVICGVEPVGKRTLHRE
uniref:splicing factor YJU2-like n=1 Tax=Euleptes europaea TaxID=460621 RepID=UPI0025409F48|nr:splicing factor YJU2-like [Euleptes europaea]